MEDFSYIKSNLAAVQEEIEMLSQRHGILTPTLACVTKSATDEELLALVRYGASDVAENRPQELTRRAALLKSNGLSVNYHQIGHLQSNKAAKVTALSPLIHSLGSESLLCELERIGERDGIESRVLIEVNSAEEEKKSGISFSGYSMEKPFAWGADFTSLEAVLTSMMELSADSVAAMCVDG